jgi:hypothetical protein
MAVKRRRNRTFIKVEIYKVDYYNLHRLTQKLTRNARPSRAATLHALLRLACQQHGIEPLEEDDPPPDRPNTDPTRCLYRRSQRQVGLREKQLLDTDGPTILDLHTIL